jgi:hypothetical protein
MQTTMSPENDIEKKSSTLFSKNVLNELRKANSQERKELLLLIEKEEHQELEALQKNPNLLLERKIDILMAEIKELKEQFNKKTEPLAHSICLYTNTSDNYEHLDSILKLFPNNDYTASNKQNCMSTTSKANIVSGSNEYIDNFDDCGECDEWFNSFIKWGMIAFFFLLCLSLISSPTKKTRPFSD